MQTFLKLLTNVTESIDEICLKDEILYMLHIRKNDERYIRTQGEPIANVIKNLVNQPEDYTFNASIFITLIEQGYI